MGIRLECQFWVENCGKAMGRPTKGCLALGRDRADEKSNKEEVCYLLLTSKLNNSHPRKIDMDHFHCLLDNMKREGKATIEFRETAETAMTVFISQAWPDHLCSFLGHFKAASRRHGTVLSQLQTVDVAQRHCTAKVNDSSSVIKMNIGTRDKYHALKQFPITLQQLNISGIQLCSVDMRWFGLRRLQHLSLAGNELGKCWTHRHWHRFSVISSLRQLKTLDLSENQFENLPDMFINALPTSLVTLNMRFNRLTKLSNRICRLQQLSNLYLDANPMEQLPEDLCLLVQRSLRLLSLSKMGCLQFLPSPLFISSQFYDKFDTLDVSGCEKAPFFTGQMAQQQQKQAEKKGAELQQPKVEGSSPPTLCELSAAAVLNNSQLLEQRSQLLRRVFADCLPRMVCSQMRDWLRRCGNCHQLYATPSGAADKSNRVELNRFANQLYGPSRAFVRLQLCARCRSRFFVR